MFGLIRVTYTIFILLALPLIILRLWWRSLKLPAYRIRIAERLGIYFNFVPVRHGLLLHAVSVGEVVAAIPLIKALQKNYPDLPLTITTTTPTGSQRVRQAFGNSVTHVYMPYDIPFALENLFKKIQPCCMVIMETELWPNLIAKCHAKKIPIFIVNGRISDRSLKRYLKFHWFIEKILRMVYMVGAQSKLDGARFLSLGLTKQQLYITGNLKFDVQLNQEQEQLAVNLKQQFKERLVLVAASTHAGEEEEVLNAYVIIKDKFPQSLLILIPRHPDRFNDVAALLTARRISFVRRTAYQVDFTTVDVMLGDTMGELEMFYAVADVAFVGGSFINLGGHNLLEPAAAGIPCLSGRCVTNFKDIAALLEDAKALEFVANANELATKVNQLFGSLHLRQTMGQSALDVVEKNRGAVAKVLRLLAPYLKRYSSVKTEL